MPLFRVYAPKTAISDIRPPAVWNGSVRPGEDIKIAFTLVDDDGETPADVRRAYSTLSLVPDERPPCWPHDYGMGWVSSGRGRAHHVIPGMEFSPQPGRINFFLPARLSGDLHGRYRLLFDVDQPDGTTTQAEGLLQVREAANVLGNRARPYMEIGVTPIGIGLIPQFLNPAGEPCDADGFPLAALAQVPPSGPTVGGVSPTLGLGVLGYMVLGSTAAPGNKLGDGVLGQMVLGA